MLARTNVMIDLDLIQEACLLTRIKTKKDVIDYALNELVQQQKRKKLLTLRHEGLWQGDLAAQRESRHDSA